MDAFIVLLSQKHFPTASENLGKVQEMQAEENSGDPWNPSASGIWEVNDDPLGTGRQQIHYSKVLINACGLTFHLAQYAFSWSFLV